MPKPGFKSVTFSEQSLSRLDLFLRETGAGASQFIELCVGAVLDMAKQPRGRCIMPTIVRVAREVLDAKAAPEPVLEDPAELEGRLLRSDLAVLAPHRSAPPAPATAGAAPKSARHSKSK